MLNNQKFDGYVQNSHRRGKKEDKAAVTKKCARL